MWWLCASVLAARRSLPLRRRLGRRLEDDPTPDVFVEALPDGATVCVVGWPDLIGEALLRRGDATVLAVDTDDDGMGSAHSSAGCSATTSRPRSSPRPGLLPRSWPVMWWSSKRWRHATTDVLATAGSRALASVGYCAEVPVWAVIGRGRCLPMGMFEAMGQRLDGSSMSRGMLRPRSCRSGCQLAPSTPHGVVPTGDAVRQPECPMSYELLRSSAM